MNVTAAPAVLLLWCLQLRQHHTCPQQPKSTRHLKGGGRQKHSRALAGCCLFEYFEPHMCISGWWCTLAGKVFAAKQAQLQAVNDTNCSWHKVMLEP